jgi:hypothetical protein
MEDHLPIFRESLDNVYKRYIYFIVPILLLLYQDAVSSTNKRSDVAKFIPKGYVLFDTVYGDLNKDGLEDCVVIIKGTKKKNIVRDEYLGMLDRNRRGILVLFKKNDNYELVLKNHTCFSSEHEDGGVYFAPELWLEIHKGNLYFHYGHGRYGYWVYTFRYQNSDLELIGFDIGQMRGPIMTSRTSINYITGKKIVETNINADSEDDESEEVFEKTESRIQITKLRRLSTIQDFDELGYEMVD